MMALRTEWLILTLRAGLNRRKRWGSGLPWRTEWEGMGLGQGSRGRLTESVGRRRWARLDVWGTITGDIQCQGVHAYTLQATGAAVGA